MCISESLVSHLASDTTFHAALAADPEAALATRGLTLTDAEREMVEHLRPLLALPADALLQRLLDGGPDGPQRWWNAPPFPAQTAP
ncbi:MAG: hypothetical protein SXV54_04155 [Chloroflexota bacterium]|nr:hypothetical protein [Chloroflexota bacterium]